ncbi:MAG: hypothetical protein J5874_05785 [Oscillospiraceae bacterium]|nr:hypothetical protein [Oscillospiraceae bacterium]
MSKRSDFLLKIAVVAVAVLAVVTLIVMRVRINQFQTEREELREEMSSYEQRIKELEERLTMPDSEFSSELQEGDAKK